MKVGKYDKRLKLKIAHCRNKYFAIIKVFYFFFTKNILKSENFRRKTFIL